jgi:predicted Zn-dependent protease
MCQCISRRTLLRGAGAAAVPLLSGCDNLPIDLVSDETVEEMGLRAWEQLTTTAPPSEEPDLQAAADRVSARLLAAAGEEPQTWQVLVLARPEVNAFAVPGNRIGVFEGLFRVVANEDQLAAIIGHEIGHIHAEHAQERMNAHVAADWGLRTVAFLLRLGDVEYAAEIAAALGLGVEYGVVLPYSRRQELEADRLGLATMAAAGFDPRTAVDLWRRMDAAAGPRLPEFLATHPAPRSRIEAIEEMLRDIG